MSHKLGMAACQEAASKYGGVCLSSEYTNIQGVYEWQCSKGHTWKTTFATIRQGSWCPTCSKNKKSINDCIDLAASFGGHCLSTEYKTAKSKYTWQCSEGHIWEATYDCVFSKKTWCPYCSNRKRKTVKDCQQLANKRGGVFLSNVYLNAHTKYEWQCAEGHEWKASYNQVEQGRWCPKCYGKISIEDCCKIASLKEGKCLSKKYVNNRTKMLWQCKHGHEWGASLASVKYKNLWCPICQGFNSKRHPPNAKDCHELANANNGKFLSDKYVKSNSKYLWECEKGHQWMATYNAVQQGYWCSKCKASKKQKYIYNVLKKHFKNYEIKFNCKDFDWLRTCVRGKMELDIYIYELKLAIEYDGEQHFMPVRFGGMSEEQAINAFERQKKRDLVKNNLIQNNEKDVKHLIRFNYKEKLTEDYIISKVKSVIS